MQCFICNSDKKVTRLKEIGEYICQRCVDYNDLKALVSSNKKKLMTFLIERVHPLTSINNKFRHRKPAHHKRDCYCDDCVEALIYKTRIKCYKEVLKFVREDCF